MAIRTIRQAVSKECLFQVLCDWCNAGSTQQKWSLNILTAFASGRAIEVLEPFFDAFLSQGNEVRVIFGIDLDGTDIGAVRRLHALSAAYHKQFNVHVWDAPQRGSLFHPKLYILEKGTKRAALVGSSNLTLGGLSGNLESLVLFDDLDRTSKNAKELCGIWDVFSSPSPPLKPSFLRPLTDEVAKELENRLPEVSREDKDGPVSGRRKLWEPLSAIQFPGGLRPRKRAAVPSKVSSYLVMDILKETRSTQVQPPAPVMEQFFGIAGTEAAELKVRLITKEGLSQPIDRHVVTSNYMRRIEVPQIRGLRRPCGVVWVRLPGKMCFAYRVISRDSAEFRDFDLFLGNRGQSTSARRYYIGRPRDPEWVNVRPLLGVDTDVS